VPPKGQQMPVSGRIVDAINESFTGFCLPADMNVSGRAPNRGLAAPTTKYGTRTMTNSGVDSR